MKPEEFIADLYQLKKRMIPSMNHDRNFIEPNTTYVLLETLIAVFYDKYNVKYEDVIKVLTEREIKDR